MDTRVEGILFILLEVADFMEDVAGVLRVKSRGHKLQISNVYGSRVASGSL